MGDEQWVNGQLSSSRAQHVPLRGMSRTGCKGHEEKERRGEEEAGRSWWAFEGGAHQRAGKRDEPVKRRTKLAGSRGDDDRLPGIS